MELIVQKQVIKAVQGWEQRKIEAIEMKTSRSCVNLALQGITSPLGLEPKIEPNLFVNHP